MTPSTLIPSQNLDLSPKKKARRGKYDQEALDALLAKAENLPDEMTAEMEEALRKYEEKKNNPYAKNYQELLKTLTPNQQEEMKKNIQINSKGGIDVIPMNIKNMKPLTAVPNNETIFDGSYTDKNGKTGIEGITYLTGKAAEKEVKKQGKKLLKDKSEVEKCISFFPGENTEEKILNFAKLFDLKKAGFWNPLSKGWASIGYISVVSLSNMIGDSGVFGIKWTDKDTNMDLHYHEYPSPFLAFERTANLEESEGFISFIHKTIKKPHKKVRP